MPRLPRLHVPGGCYHVVMRGNHREDLFETANDRHVLNDIVAEALLENGARLHVQRIVPGRVVGVKWSDPNSSVRCFVARSINPDQIDAQQH